MIDSVLFSDTKIASEYLLLSISDPIVSPTPFLFLSL